MNYLCQGMLIVNTHLNNTNDNFPDLIDCSETYQVRVHFKQSFVAYGQASNKYV